MGYGVNKWASPSGRAPAAAKRKKPAKRTAKKSASGSARPAKKKSKPRKKPSASKRTVKKTAPKKKKAAPKKKKATKAKLYTRYDPTTGQKVRVTVDSFEYSEWPSRKPTKKKIQREALKRDPIGTSSQVLLTGATKAAERTIERQASRTARSIATSAGVAGGVRAAAAAAPAAIGIAAAGLVGAALYAMAELAKQTRISAGEAANRVSREFATTQAAVAKQFGGWANVPKQIQDRLVNGYKKEIANVYAFRPIAGTLQPSKSIPYGR